MGFAERLRWMARMAMLLFILASVAFLSALTAMRFAIRGREVPMPDLAGMPASEARPMLESLHVGLKVEDRIYSQWPVDAVVRQSPLPNMNVKVGQDAHVVLSLGPQKVTIPGLEGKSVRAAQVELLRGGMQLGEMSSLYLPASNPDVVAEQYPIANTSDATSSHVDFLVTLGPRPSAYVMPDFSGVSLADAEARLSAAGLKVAKFTPVSAPGAPHGTVVEQNPTRGERVDKSSPIEFQVAN
jgi:eukaryotic-like serine/threonine-protein kinase